MDMNTKIRLVSVLSEYIHEDLVYGSMDCNLLVMKAFEPIMYDKFVGRYTTIVGGARVAKKEFGYARLDEFIENSVDYVQIKSNFIMHGDIIFSDVGRVAMISLGIGRAFVIDPKTNKFEEGHINIPQTYKIFRRL